MKHINRELRAVLKPITPEIDEDAVNILISHLTVQGGKTSDSERPLTIGTVESVQKGVFDILIAHARSLASSI